MPDASNPRAVGWTPYTINATTAASARSGITRRVRDWLDRYRPQLDEALRARTADMIGEDYGKPDTSSLMMAADVDAYITTARAVRHTEAREGTLRARDESLQLAHAPGEHAEPGPTPVTEAMADTVAALRRSYAEPGPGAAEREVLAEALADELAQWWQAHTGEETYAHQWTAHAERVVTDGPDRST